MRQIQQGHLIERMKRGRAYCFYAMIALPLFFISSSAASSAQSPSDNSEGYYIEITGRTGIPIGEPVEQLSAKNFAVSQTGHKYSIRVSQPLKTKRSGEGSYPTHLLVVLPADAPRPKDEDLARDLKKAFAEDWLVSVNRLDGSFTPYAPNADALLSSLEQDASTPMSAPGAMMSIWKATDDLSWLPGRRVLLAINPKTPARPFVLWFTAQTKLLPSVYLIDGGIEVSESVVVPRSMTGMQDDSFVVKQRMELNGFYHEVNFKDAISDMVWDARLNYDLAFTVPSSQKWTSQAITLILHHAEVLGALRAEIYSVATKTVDGVPVVRRSRTPPMQQLIVGQK